MTAPAIEVDGVTVWHGDSLQLLRAGRELGYDFELGYEPDRLFPDASFDAVVTDPPYGLEFMGKDWDAPWQKGAGVGGHSAGFGQTGFTDGSQRLHRPSYIGGTNPTCRNCGGLRYGREGKQGQPPCRCGSPRFDNTTIPRMRAFQDWCERWAAECLRVLKPGGFMLAFGGMRTQHRLACAIEDAGFEIRDAITWIYGQGFAKSLNLDNIPASKSPFCKCGPVPYNHDRRDVFGMREGVPDSRGLGEAGEESDLFPSMQRGSAGAGMGDLRDSGTEGQGSVRPEVRTGQPGVEGRSDIQTPEGQLRRPEVCALPTGSSVNGEVGRLRDGASTGDGQVGGTPADPFGVRESPEPRPERQSSGEPGAVPVERGPQAWRGRPVCGGCGKPRIPAGLGTALKPASEIIVVARKPLAAGTVAANVLQHGTGALNIDACRTGLTGSATHASKPRAERVSFVKGFTTGTTTEQRGQGRWPTNVVLDDRTGPHYGDSGGASRFFPTFRYEPKAGAGERPKYWRHACDCAHGSPMPAGGVCEVCGEPGELVAHPTVKPLDLMAWLVRLVTPPGGRVLDLFAGTGTTAEACLVEGMECVLIEREADYLPLIRQRLDRPVQAGLFGLDP